MDTESYHWSYQLFAAIFLLADFTIRIILSARVVMKKKPYGVSLAWLVVILLIPFAGSIFYLLIGENRLSDRRIKRMQTSQDHYQAWLKTLSARPPVDWQDSDREHIQIQARKLAGIPALPGNELKLIQTPEDILHSIVEDIKNSSSTCHLQFYIWKQGGIVDEVSQALIEAAQRGVTCRLLLDDIGSRDFLGSPYRKKLEQHGIRIRQSLPAGLFKAFFSRIDIRNHRKIVVIDGKIAYTGSQNMVDPKYFKQDQGVGQWIDLMVKIQGPVVEALAGTFINDWFLETDPDPVTGRSLHADIKQVRSIADLIPLRPTGDTAVQFVPSGPGFTQESIHRLLLTSIYAARKKLILTTPYFVPDQSLLTALQSAAERGVKVSIILPKRNDSKLVAYASKAHFEQLSRAGVKIYLFNRGLLHAKTISVDDDFSLFGSVNMDMRSFWLNFEATIAIYSTKFTLRLQKIQKSYMKNSRLLNVKEHKKRPAIERFKENMALLIGPLL